jgi:hypothetical protein
MSPRQPDVSRLWHYNDREAAKPFVHPLRLQSGAVLSCDGPPSYAWHHGLWFAIKYVNGTNFWEEDGEFGTVRARASRADGDELDWLHPDGTVVIDERRRLTGLALAGDAYAIDWAIDLTPRVDVTLDREPYNGVWGGYSGLAFRGRPDFTDTKLLLPSGPADAERIEGEPAPWIDLSGTVDGVTGGVAVLDAPDNPNHPVPWYASTRGLIYGDEWGNFVNAAFLWDGPVAVGAGSTLSFRYRVIVHDGIWEGDRLAVEFAHYRDSLAS